MNNKLLQLWKLTAKYNLIRVNKMAKSTNSPHLTESKKKRILLNYVMLMSKKLEREIVGSFCPMGMCGQFHYL